MNPYTKELHTIVFDIETMGLMPQHDMVINAGFCDPESCNIFQLFAENFQDEKRLIEEILEILSRYEAVITYNGDRFDIPFIQTRAKKYGINKMPLFWSIDMYRYLKKYWPMAKRMQHLNQKSVEYALSLSENRTDEIPGDECIRLYKEYVNNGDEKAKELILLHNADDVRQLAKIYNACNFLPYDQISFEMGFGILSSKYSVYQSARLDKNNLYIKAITTPGGIPSSIYEDSYRLEYNCFTGEIDLQISLLQEGRMSYLDLTKLPCNKDDLKDLRGYHSDFLVIRENSQLNYQEINRLIASILSNEGLF